MVNVELVFASDRLKLTIGVFLRDDFADSILGTFLLNLEYIVDWILELYYARLVLWQHQHQFQPW